MSSISNKNHGTKNSKKQKILNKKAVPGKSGRVEVKAPPIEMDMAAGSEKINPFASQIASQYNDSNLSPTMVSGIIRLVEFFGIGFMGIAIYANYVSFSVETPIYLVGILVGSLLAVIALQTVGCYHLQALRSPFKKFHRVVFSLTGAFAVMATAVFFAKMGADFSRVWFASWFIASILCVSAIRFFISLAIKRWARNGTMERRAVIVGGGPSAEKLIRSIEVQRDNDIRICGIFDDRGAKRSPHIIAGYPKLGTVDELVEFARISNIDMFIVNMPIAAQSRVLELMKKLWVIPVDIRLAALSQDLKFRPRAYSYVGNAPMLDILDKPITDWDSVAKRAFDIFFSIFAIVTLWPIMLGAALAVKVTSRGPILFKQKRHGFNNEIVEVYKFRSMYTEDCDYSAAKSVTKNDSRVTPVGRFIRKTSIDELPQFFNALMGSLSLVGPRPHAVQAQAQNRLYAEVVDGYFARHRVKPGVTGWAQINGWRGEIDHDDKIKQRTAFDLYYIENWSIWFDLKILFLTPIRLFNTENAY